jgi:hypothetical protein
VRDYQASLEKLRSDATEAALILSPSTVAAEAPAQRPEHTHRLLSHPQLRKHPEVTRRAGSAYSRRWADISFSNAHGWARTYSIGFRKSRRRTSPIPMPMRPSSVSPAPGFISSTRKPGNSSARTDAATGSMPARTQARALSSLLYFSPGTDSAAARSRIGSDG